MSSQQVPPKFQDILPCRDLLMSCFDMIYRCDQTVCNQFPARSVVRYGLICIIFGVFSFTDFVSWFLISKKLKRSDWISNSRASNFRIGFPSWRRTKRGGARWYIERSPHYYHLTTILTFKISIRESFCKVLNKKMGKGSGTCHPSEVIGRLLWA